MRQSRKDLMEQNKKSKPVLPAVKYFKYAIRDIVLVVFGILIALQINNWNQNRKAKIGEQNVLYTLHKDLNMALVNGQNYLENQSMQVKILNDYIISSVKRDSLLSLDNGEYLIMKGLWTVEFQTPVVSVFEDMKNSGTTAIISNQEIRKNLAALHVSL